MLPNARNHFPDYFLLRNQTLEFHFPYRNSFALAFILHLEFYLHRAKRSLRYMWKFFPKFNTTYEYFFFLIFYKIACGDLGCMAIFIK